MPVAVALVVVLLSQVGFWLLLYTHFFLSALVANALFWCVAFPAWASAGRRWWRTSATPDVSLALLLTAMTVASFWLLSQRFADEASEDAWGWLGFFGVPLALAATVFATLRVRAVRRATGFDGTVAADAKLGPRPATVAVIAAVIIALALVVFALLLAVSIGGPH
jgi:hypothetical protein